jgi:hypothetical protein
MAPGALTGLRKTLFSSPTWGHPGNISVFVCSDRFHYTTQETGGGIMALPIRAWVTSTSMKNLVYACGLLVCYVTAANGGVPPTKYQAFSDPKSEGFSTWQCCGSGGFGTLVYDLGLRAWSMVSNGTRDQFCYQSQLDNSQQQGFANRYVLTMVGRVVSGPIYTQEYPVEIMSASYQSSNSSRTLLGLGLDVNGNTVVILDSTYGQGPGGEIIAQGQTYTVSGSDYHTYQLVWSSGSADLFVDGNEVLSGYVGDRSFPMNPGLLNFCVASGGVANFNEVELLSQ